MAQNASVVNPKNGLSNNYAQCMLQDAQGYVWIGTRDGLNRFDSHTVTVYREQLPSSFIYSLLQHSSGEIWIGTSQGGVSIYDPSKDIFHTLATEERFGILRDKDVYELFEDSQHNVWVGTLQGLGKIPESRDTLYWHEQEGIQFTAAIEDDEHAVWIGSSNGIFKAASVATPGLNVLPTGLAENVFVRDIIIDGNRSFWLATDDQGVLHIEDHLHVNTFPTGTLGSKPLQVWKLFRDVDGDLWAAVINGGAFKFNAQRQKFEKLAENKLAPFNSTSITGIFRDHQQNLWIASHGDGVCYVNPERYVFEKHLSGESGRAKNPVVVSALYEDDTQRIWIGTDGDGMMQWEQGKEIKDVYSSGNGLSSDIILDINADPSGGLWISTWQGGANFIRSDFKTPLILNSDTRDPLGLKVNNLKSIMIDSAGHVWMATHGGGIVIYDRKTKTFMDPKDLVPGYWSGLARWGSDILRSTKNEIWIASHAGLCRITKDSLFQYSSAHLESSLVYCVFEDSESTIWIGTNSSLERFDREKNTFENYSHMYDIPGNVKCIVQDERQHLWFSTIHEIIEFDPVSKKVKRYDESYNIQRGQFYECSCLKASDGRLLFGGTEGLNMFHPDSLQEIKIKTRLQITDVFLFGKKQKPGDVGSILTTSMPFTREIHVNYDQNVIAFEFLAINYSAGANVKYSYMLENFNTEWSPPANAAMATYTNLDPGQYTFQVRASSVNGEILGETQVRINVIPPFWLTLWFKVLMVVALIAVTSGYLLLRLHGSRKKRLLLQKLVDERTREVLDKNELLEEQAWNLRTTNESLVAQDEIIKKQRDQLQENNVALQDVVFTKDRLFSIIAHDLRNPFTSLIGMTRLLNSDYDKYTSDERISLIKKLYHSSATIYGLLDNLLVWSKSQQNELLFEPERVTFSAFVADHFDLISVDAEKKHVRLKLMTEGDATFLADRNMLSIILRNLLSNALRYSPINGNIKVGYRFAGTGIEIFVQDEGPGVDDPTKLFDPRLQKQFDHSHGLGLVLCREFVEKHGGTIAASKNPDQGLTVIFTIPDSDAKDLVSTSGTTSDEIEITPNTDTADARPIVLVAEDDDDIRWYIKEVLRHDFNVFEAMNGREGTTLALGKMPDVIISDMNMPGTGGLDFCMEIKKNSLTCHIPFLLLTAERGSEKKISGYQAGVDDYITKPIEPDVLRARVHNVLHTRNSLKRIYQLDITAEPGTYTTNERDREFLEKLNALIITRITDDTMNPDSLAQEMHMSRTGLYMKVKALAGESVAIYVRNVRLKESQKLLRSGTMNISEVAYAVGFNQLPYFTSCFKDAFGITPTEFTQKQRA